MDNEKKIKISIRSLVEFVLRSGDLDMRFMGSSRAVEGTKAHQKLQKAAGDDYNAEVPLSIIIEREGIVLEVGGRADGIIINGKSVIIDEIKTTTRPLEYIDEDYNILHWAQAKSYGYIYALQNDLDKIGIQITYYQIDQDEVKQLFKSYSFEELEIDFYDVVDKYIEWAKTMHNWYEVRDSSIKAITFPFKNYREGQRDLAVGVYTTIKEEGKLFAQAPTGIGKTIATIFPTVKAIGERLSSKLFYLTAKTITRTIAEKALENMRESGLRFKSVTLTAKDKICPNPGVGCNPDSCEYAKGHFDRINDAIKDIFQKDSFDRESIETCAKKYNICPFEFSLDLCLWADGVICDYNYVFDPRVYLKRFFLDNSGDYTFLIDEAHNIVDRGREMFSADLSKKIMLELKKKTKDSAPEVSKALNKLNSFMVSGRKLCEDNGFYIDKEFPQDIYPLLRKFSKEAEVWLLNNEEEEYREELLEFYFKVLGFIRTSETYDERYITYYEKNGDEVVIKLFCLDPSFLLSEAMKRGRASILFSATLTPLEYFMKILGGDENSYRLRLKSPFPSENLCLLIDNKTSTKYKQRQFTYDKVTNVIEKVVKGHKGNYLVFLPSYKYMNEIYSRFAERNEDVKVIVQKPNMTEEDREEFIRQFKSINRDHSASLREPEEQREFKKHKQFDKDKEFEEYEELEELEGHEKDEEHKVHELEGLDEIHELCTLDEIDVTDEQGVIAFAVMGGIFGEGIDLVGDRLSGAIIVGVGLPQICFEREIIRDHFQKEKGSGFEYAYIYPGMNKVMQAVGRVIRTEEDKGVVMLIDERFAQNPYRSLFPEEWAHAVNARNLTEIEQQVEKFWTAR